ncbi:MAG: Na+/H+ antiporter subunit D [Actinomycetota bacterium]|nr:Na+/H+ antiporter subunit D [Actinomycetota bacterium]
MTASPLVSVLGPMPVLLPLLAAGLALLFTRSHTAQRLISLIVLTTMLAIAVTLLVVADQQGAQAVALGGWEPPLGVVLVVDRLSALMLVVSSTVMLGVLAYAVGQGTRDDDDETPVSIYHPTYLVLAAGVSNAFLAGDLFNLYVGFEMLLTASYVLLTLGGTEARVRAGVTYVIMSLLSSVLFLAAIGLVYGATGTVNLAHLAEVLPTLPDGTRLLLHVGLLLAFGIKAAVFPLAFWLPDSYPTAPAPVAAVFAGLLTKVGVYAIIRTETLLFPGGELRPVLMVVALLTLLVGILGAVAQSDLKRLLSFTLVSHIGYMVFGVALGSAAGVGGAVFYVVHHITIQTALFLACGLVDRRGGTTALRRLGGLAQLSPVLGVLFFVPAMNLAGVPPFSGFVGKLGLFRAGAEDGGVLAYALLGAGALTSLLTLYAVARVWNLAFWRSAEEAQDPEPELLLVRTRPGVDDPHRQPEPTPSRTLMPPVMVGATTAMVAVGVALAVLAGPLWALTTRAAEDLRDRTPYITAVLPDGVPAPLLPKAVGEASR